MKQYDLSRKIIDTTHALIVVLDTEGRVVMFNRACERVSGYRFEEASGWPIWDFLLLPEEIDGVKAVFEELRVGHFPNTFENHWVTKSGERRFIEWSNSAVTDASGRVTHVIGTGIDVTEKRAAERALRDSEGRFRQLAGSLPLVFWVRELPSKRISYVSPAYEAIWGRKLVDLDEAFRSFLESIHPDDREMLFRQMERETEAHDAAETEYRIIRPDGSVRWIHSNGIPIRDEVGQVVQIVGFAQDVTDRKLVEGALRASEQRQLALLEAIPEPVWMKDREGRYLMANRAFRDRVAPGTGDLIGESDFDIYPAAEAESKVNEDRAIMATKLPVRKEWAWVVQEQKRWYDTIKVPIIDDAGEAIGTAGISRDVTARKHTERLLQEIQQRQKALLDSIPDIAWLKDSGGSYIAVNQLFGQVFNVEAEKIRGKTDFDIFPQAAAAQFSAEDRAVMAAGEPHRYEELLTRNDRKRWMETVKVPIKNGSGAIIGIAGVSRDITERKLSEANRIARDAALRTAFVKDLHHRIKNNLQGVVTLVERWATQHPEHTDLWDAVITRINAIAAVHGLHGSTGELELRLDQILLRLVSSLKSLFGDLPVQLSIRSKPATVRVTESEIVPLALIVNELIMNSVKHSRSSVDSKAVDVALDSAGDSARVIFRNHTGKLPAQFDFDTGAGLSTGLSLVKSLLPNHGALLRFENMAGPEGVTVELTLRPPVITFAASET